MKRTNLGLLTRLAGPGFPPPVGRRQTFIEWVLNTVFRLACLFVSLSALAFFALIGGAALLVLAAAL